MLFETKKENKNLMKIEVDVGYKQGRAMRFSTQKPMQKSLHSGTAVNKSLA